MTAILSTKTTLISRDRELLGVGKFAYARIPDSMMARAFAQDPAPSERAFAEMTPEEETKVEQEQSRPMTMERFVVEKQYSGGSIIEPRSNCPGDWFFWCS